MQPFSPSGPRLGTAQHDLAATPLCCLRLYHARPTRQQCTTATSVTRKPMTRTCAQFHGQLQWPSLPRCIYRSWTHRFSNVKLAWHKKLITPYCKQHSIVVLLVFLYCQYYSITVFIKPYSFRISVLRGTQLIKAPPDVLQCCRFTSRMQINNEFTHDCLLMSRLCIKPCNKYVLQCGY